LEFSVRILVTGSREWRQPAVIAEAILAAASEAGVPLGEVTVVHGGCPRGADQIASDFVRFHPELAEEAHPANWRKFGRRAGYARNDFMIRLGADVCLAFIRNGSAGTSMCSRLAEDAGIPVRRFEDNEPDFSRLPVQTPAGARLVVQDDQLPIGL
jgi:hypothetical protein